MASKISCDFRGKSGATSPLMPDSCLMSEKQRGLCDLLDV